MQDVEVIIGGYVTNENAVRCKTLELCATSNGTEKVDYYVNEKDQLFSIHFARMLDLRLSVCAIDFFPDYNRNEINKVAAIIQKELLRKV